jgi:hypothetical protein
MSETERGFGKGEVRKDNPPKEVKKDTAKGIGSTAIGGATKDK